MPRIGEADVQILDIAALHHEPPVTPPGRYLLQSEVHHGAAGRKACLHDVAPERPHQHRGIELVCAILVVDHFLAHWPSESTIGQSESEFLEVTALRA
jgi:hypothetical protein